MSSLWASLSQVLLISLEEDILDNILESMNLLDRDQDAKFVEDSVEEKMTLSALYESISRAFIDIRDVLFHLHHQFATPATLSQLIAVQRHHPGLQCGEGCPV